MEYQRVNPLIALRKNPFVLAPMAGITDCAYRSFMKNLGSSLVISELVSATGLQHRSARTEALMSFNEDQRPVGIQLFGENPQEMAWAAQFVEERGADFVDVNFGCPVPKVVKKGAGSAMMKDLPAMERLLSAMVKSVKIPVTIKIRTGWDQTTRNASDVVQLAADCGVTWVAIHGRTRAQGYSGQSDWDFITEVKNKASIPVLGNGDVLTPAQAVSRMKSSGVDGVLIGRGALKNPFIFMDSMALWAGQEIDRTINRDYRAVFLSLKQCFAAHCSERILQIQLKKFAAWFATGYPGASQFRKSIFQELSAEEITGLALDYFSSINQTHQADTSTEAFLMGGHG